MLINKVFTFNNKKKLKNKKKNFFKRINMFSISEMNKSLMHEKFKCEECKKTFRYKDSLVKHYRTHTGERPYKCIYCPKSFSQINNRLRHERTHLPPSFECKICFKKFSRRESLKTHSLKYHKIDKFYECKKCPKRFSLSKELSRHKKYCKQITGI